MALADLKIAIELTQEARIKRLWRNTHGGNQFWYVWRIEAMLFRICLQVSPVSTILCCTTVLWMSGHSLAFPEEFVLFVSKASSQFTPGSHSSYILAARKTWQQEVVSWFLRLQGASNWVSRIHFFVFKIPIHLWKWDVVCEQEPSTCISY